MLPLLLACVDADPDPSGPPPAPRPAPTTTTSSPEPTPWSWPFGALVLPDVTVIDASGRRGPVTVVVADGVIAAVLEEDPGPPPADAQVLDVAGRTVTPGLIDPHVHLFLSGTPWWVGDTLAANLSATVAAGVTTVVDAGGPLRGTELRDRIRAAEILGPDLLVLGPMVTAPGSHPCEGDYAPDFCTLAADAAEGAAAAAERLAAGTDGIKLAVADADFTPWPTPRLSAEALEAAVSGSGGLAYAHVDEEDDALLALDAGVGHLAHPVFGGPPAPPAVARIAAEATATHTTLGAFSGTLELLDGTLPVDHETIDPRVTAAWQWVRSNPDAVDPEWILGSELWTAEATATLGLLDDAGALLLPASDAGYYYVPHGLGLHLELERLEARGFDRAALLAAATAEAAAALGLADRGRVEVGQRADLLVVDGDPLADLAALRAPEWVLVAGQPRARGDLVGADPLLGASAAAPGAFCLDDRDCDGGRCDLVDHVCALACDVVGQYEDPCGASAWCAPAEGDRGDPVCHEVRTCDLYDVTSCAPEPYVERCVPLDLDTSGCSPAGTRTVGQACDPLVDELSCEPGLYCSWIDARCWELCDPSGPDTCPAGRTCVDQWPGPRSWFGLCEPS